MGSLKLAFNARTLVDPNLRGWTRYTINLIEALLEYDIKFYLFTDRPIADVYLQRLPKERFHVECVQSKRYALWEQKVLPSLCKKHSIDILHCPINYGLPAIAPCPTVLTLHDAITEVYYHPLRSLRERLNPSSIQWNFLAWLSRRFANHVITVSEHAKLDLVEHLKIPSEKISVIYEAADPVFNQYPSDEEIEMVLKRHEIRKPYFFYIGGWERRKNIPFMLKAFDKADLEVQMVMAGGQKSQRKEFEKNFSSLGDRLKLLEWVEDEDLPALYAGARAFIYPSEYEGFGLQVCEAMAMKCPVLVSDVTSLPEIAGEAGYPFTLDRIDSLKENMEKIVCDETLYEDLSEKSFFRSQEFSWAKAAEETYQVYQNLVGS